MDFALTPEQDQLRQSVRSFLDDLYPSPRFVASWIQPRATTRSSGCAWQTTSDSKGS